MFKFWHLNLCCVVLIYPFRSCTWYPDRNGKCIKKCSLHNNLLPIYAKPFLQIGAVARIRHQLAFATHRFFHENAFLYVHTPIITTSDCEGAGEMFQVTTLFSQAEKTEKELKENPAPSESEIEAAKVISRRKEMPLHSLKLQKPANKTYQLLLMGSIGQKNMFQSWRRGLS